MKIKCLQENLYPILKTVWKAVPARSVLPITHSFLLSSVEGRLRVTAGDLEEFISEFVPAEVEGEGGICVSAATLLEIVGNMPAEKMDIEITDNSMAIECGRYRCVLYGVKGTDFPPVPKMESEIRRFLLPAVDLRRALLVVDSAAYRDHDRPILCGVNLRGDGKVLTLAAADGYRLAIVKVASEVKGLDVVVPNKTVKDVESIIRNDDSEIDIAIDVKRRQSRFTYGDIEITSELNDGIFPKYEQMIPESSASVVMMDRLEMLRACRLACAVARDGAGVVRILFTTGVVHIRAKTAEDDSMCTVDGALSGPEGRVALNGRYLLDALNSLESERVKLGVNVATSPVVLRPEDSEDVLYVLMPMFVQWD